MLLESDYIHPPKSLPPIPVRVSRRSQLTAALRQHARPIVIEDQGLARPFARISLGFRCLLPWQRSHLPQPLQCKLRWPALSPTYAVFGAYLNSHSRFGRGRGKGTARRSTTAICAGCVTDGVEDVKKATIGSSDADLRTAAGLGIKPVSSSLVGTCLPPPLSFRTRVD